MASSAPKGIDRKENEISLFGLTLKAIVAHTLTYFRVGFLAFMIFDYAGLPRPKCGRECTKPTNWLLGILFVLVIFMSLIGYLVAFGTFAVPA